MLNMLLPACTLLKKSLVFQTACKVYVLHASTMPFSPPVKRRLIYKKAQHKTGQQKFKALTLGLNQLVLTIC